MGYRHLMSVVLVALIVCVAVTAAAAARTKDNEGGGAFTSEELQAAIRSFADSWSSQIVEATYAWQGRWRRPRRAIKPTV